MANHSELDGLIKQENQDLRDRVTDLEKKVGDQTDEIVCLKSAVADCLRRLHQLEASKGIYVPRSNPNASVVHVNQCSAASEHHTFQGVGKSSHTSGGGQRRPNTPRSGSASREKRGGSGSSQGHTGGSGSHTPRSLPRPGSSSGGRDGGSVSSMDSPGGRHNTRGPKSSKEPIYMKGTTVHIDQRRPAREVTVLGRSVSVESLRTSFDRTIDYTTGDRKRHLLEKIRDEGILKISLRGRPVNMYAPSELNEYDVRGVGELPHETLKLEWVYGYRGRDCRSNVFFLPTGEVVYFVAAVVILYNVEEQMQRHYLGHTDDVKCLAVHPDRITMASGQTAGHEKTGKAHARVWDSVSLNTLHIIGLGDFERCVACLAFSRADGSDHLCCIDESNDHTISVWDWQAGRKVTETKSSTEPILAVEFNPLEPNSIVTCGKNHLAFWHLDGCQLSRKMGIYEKYDKPKFVLCITFLENGDLITGDSNGNIFIWGKGSNRISHAILGAHEGPVFSVCLLKDGHLISGGGKDRKIVHWDAAYNRSGQVAELPSLYGAVRTLSSGPGNTIFVGTTKNCLLQGSIGLDFSPVVEGHQDELWGLAVHPSHHQFLTCAYDCAVSLWDALTHQTVWTRELSDPVHSAAFYPNGELVAVGTQTGRWIVLEVLRKGDILAVHTDGSEQIEAMQYSPDGNMLALASRDSYIYVYATVESGRKYSRIGKCAGHSSSVLHIDWSVDNHYLRSTSQDYEVLFWTANNCRQVVTASQLRDTQWATHSCTLGFHVAGIWPEGADGTDVNACARANNQRLLVSADDFGKVNLYRYPSIQPHSPKHAYVGHSSHVTNVGFLCDDSRLISTGGKDTAIMQWEVIA